MRRGLHRDVDHLKVVERLAVRNLDMPDAIVEAAENRASVGLNNSKISVLAGERFDRVHGFPACDHHDLDPAISFDALDSRAEKPVRALELHADRSVEVRHVRISLL